MASIPRAGPPRPAATRVFTSQKTMQSSFAATRSSSPCRVRKFRSMT
jgi:hypothetical protein